MYIEYRRSQTKTQYQCSVHIFLRVSIVYSTFLFQDINSKESFLTFYLDYDKLEPYFIWLHVKQGRIVVVVQPYLPYFMDGQAGFKIEEPHEVRFIAA